MHEKERVVFQSLPQVQKPDYFYTLWSGKESLIKVWGKGFHHPVTDINLMASDIRNQDQYYHHENRLYHYKSLEMTDSLEDYAVAISYEK